MEANAAALSGHPTSKGAIRFTPSAPHPGRLVETLVRARIGEVEAALGR